MSIPAHLHTTIREAYIRGATLSELCQAHNVSRFEIAGILDTPEVQRHTTSRLQSLKLRGLEFRMRAFDYAEDALDNLAKLRDSCAEDELKRKIDNDLIRIAGLEPRRIVQVTHNNGYTIDDETHTWMKSIMAESGVIDAEIIPPTP